MTLGERDDLFAAVQQDRVGRDEKGVRFRAEKFFERAVELVRVAGVDCDGFQTKLGMYRGTRCSGIRQEAHSRPEKAPYLAAPARPVARSPPRRREV
jgi:hypothetical protein